MNFSAYLGGKIIYPLKKYLIAYFSETMSTNLLLEQS